MQILLRAVQLIALMAVSAVLQEVRGQASACRAPSDVHQIVLIGFRDIASSLDSAAVAARQRDHIPPADTSQVHFVTNDAQLCTAALATYNYAVTHGTPSTSVLLLRVGAGYIAFDPERETSRFGIFVIMNATFGMINKIVR